MRVLVTGAGGFVGLALAGHLLREGQVAGQRIASLALLDRQLAARPGAQSIEGDLGDRATLARIAAFNPDTVFHLAAVPGGAAESDYANGRRVNLDATLALFETLAALRKPVVVVYASTIAVYGAHLPDPVTPGTPLRPALTYGAHKLACETLLADFSRRGLLDGRSLRLPGIVARPRGAGGGLKSAFMSELLHALAAGEAFTCPVGPGATAWWMSAQCCAGNLVHAAGMDVRQADFRRAWPLPVLRASIGQVVEAAADLFPSTAQIAYRPDDALEAVFGRYPRLDDTEARALGLRCDGSLRELLLRATGVAAPELAH
jgi:nucleoside-diphosphate-sugar epimerase